jgi:hypothetical protein
MTPRIIERQIILTMISDHLQKNEPSIKLSPDTDHISDLSIALSGIQGCFDAFLQAVDAFKKENGINQ